MLLFPSTTTKFKHLSSISFFLMQERDKSLTYVEEMKGMVK